MAQSVGAVALDIVMGRNTVSGVARQAIADVQQVFNDGTATIGNKVSVVGQACKNVGASLMPVSAAAQGVIATTANAAMSFETAMAQVETIAGNASVSYKGSMTDMSNAIMQLSTDTGIAAEDVAAATYNAISAGVDVSKSVEFVATANALAVGGFTDMTTSVDVLTTTLNAYGEKAGTAESISDKLITTQNLGKTTVNELASSMGKVIPTASAYGISIDNLCASYVAMTKGGIATAESTTYMKSMFNELADSGSTVGKILQENTGKSFGQLMNEGKSLADVIDILGQSVDGDSEKFAQLWGSSEAGTGALAILNGGTADFNNTLNEMGNSTGAASSAMDKMNDTSAHKLQTAMNDLKNSAIELGGAFAPVMSGVASAVGNVARAFGNLPAPVKNTIAVIIMIIAVAAPLIMIIGGVISGIGSIISVAGVLGGALGGLTVLFNPITLAIGAVVAAGAVLIANWDSIKELAGMIGESISNAWNDLKTKTSETWNSMKSKASETWTNMKSKASETFNSIKTNASNKVNEAKTAIVNGWSSAKNATSNAFNNMKQNASNTWNNIKSTVSNAANNARSNAVNAFSNMKSGISNAGTGIKNAVSNVFNNTRSTIKNFSSQAVSWGKDFVDGLASGIRNAASKVIDAASSLGSKIRSFLHFSRPDEGPLRDYETWMPDFVQGMTNGINDNKYKLIDAVRSMSNEMSMPAFAGVPAMTPPALKNVGSNTIPTGAAGDDKLYGLLTQLITKLDNNNGGDITVPVYLGNDIIDEQIIRANDRRTVRSGGRS